MFFKKQVANTHNLPILPGQIGENVLFAWKNWKVWRKASL